MVFYGSIIAETPVRARELMHLVAEHLDASVIAGAQSTHNLQWTFDDKNILSFRFSKDCVINDTATTQQAIDATLKTLAVAGTIKISTAVNNK